jgi:hypothetical protein
MDVWSHIESMAGKTLATLERGKAFDIVKVGSSRVVVRPHASNTARSIERRELEGAFKELSLQGELSRSRIQQQYSDWNSAFVAAMLADIPGVRIAHKPIRLLYG